MKEDLIKILILIIMISIPVFLFPRNVYAACRTVVEERRDTCTGGVWQSCPNPSYGCIPGREESCVGCNVDTWYWRCCEDCADCRGGGGGTPDTTKPKCGVRIEPQVVSGNLITNGNFETGNLAPWSVVSGGPGVTKRNVWDYHVNEPDYVVVGSQYSVEQHINVETGAIYQVSLWAKAQHYAQGGEECWGVSQVMNDPYPAPPNDVMGKIMLARGKYNSDWVQFNSTFRAQDGQMTIRLIGDRSGDACWFDRVAFDDVVVQKLEGAASAPGSTVSLKIGVWDNRELGAYRIKNSDAAWGNWQDIPWVHENKHEFFANPISWTLSSSGGVDVQLKDEWGNESDVCSDTVSVPQPPTCVSCTASPTSGLRPLTVNFTASGTDPDGTVTAYQWDFDGNGTWDTTTTLNTTSYTYNTAGTYTAKVRVQDNNGTWGTVLCSCTLITVIEPGKIQGTVYEISNPADRTCLKINSGTLPGLSGVTISTSGTASLSTTSNPNYSFTNLYPGTYILTASKADYSNPLYCPGKSVSVSGGGTETVNIGLMKIFGAWFQTEGGDVHAQTEITNPIPGSCVVPGCEPYCSLLGDGGYPGVISYGTSYDFSAEAGNGRDRVSPDPPAGWLANSTAKANWYGYFYSLLGSPEENWDGRISTFPGFPGSGETRILYTGTNVAHIPAGTFSSGGKLVILADANAIIDQGNIIVTPGSFLAVIASGHINIDDAVGEVQGIYIADGHISTGDGDISFTGEGMFISKERPALGRDFEDERNNSQPTETFVFRPDLWLNSPSELWLAPFTWQELAP